MFVLLRYEKRSNLAEYSSLQYSFNLSTKNVKSKFLINSPKNIKRRTIVWSICRYRDCGPRCRSWRIILRARSLGRTVSQNRDRRRRVIRQDRHTHTHIGTNHLSSSCLCVYVACPSGSRREGGKRQCVLTVGPMSAALRRRNGLGRPIGRVAKTARPKTPG